MLLVLPQRFDHKAVRLVSGPALAQITGGTPKIAWRVFYDDSL